MLNPAQFHAHIVRPVLTALEMGGDRAEAICLGTVAAESGFQWLVQRGSGPACGLGQVEPLTGQDVLQRYLAGRPDLLQRFANAVGVRYGEDPAPLLAMSLGEIRLRLIADLRFNLAILRCRYWMDPAPLPAADDVEALGETWKRVYNTAQGAGTVEHFVAAWRACGLDEVVIY